MASTRTPVLRICEPVLAAEISRADWVNVTAARAGWARTSAVSMESNVQFLLGTIFIFVPLIRQIKGK